MDIVGRARGLSHWRPKNEATLRAYSMQKHNLVAALDQPSMRASEPLPTRLGVERRPALEWQTRPMTNTFTHTEIESVGQGRLTLRCRRCGLIDDGSDREFLQHLADQHDKICPALNNR